MAAPVLGDNYGGYTITDLNAEQVINDQFVPMPNESELLYTFNFPPDQTLYWSLPVFPGEFIQWNHYQEMIILNNMLGHVLKDEDYYDNYLVRFAGNRLLSYGGSLSLTQRFESGGYPDTSTPDIDVIFVGDSNSVYWSNPTTLTSGQALVSKNLHTRSKAFFGQ